MADSIEQKKLEKLTESEDNKAELAYKFLLQVRELDNKLMWTRINIMFLIQGILFSFVATAFSSLVGKYTFIIVLTEVFGLISAYFLRFIASGGDFWETFWERKLSEIEQKAIGNFEIFRNHPTTSSEVSKKVKGEGGKPIRKAVVIFSFMFLIVWLVLIFYTIIVAI